MSLNTQELTSTSLFKVNDNVNKDSGFMIKAYREDTDSIYLEYIIGESLPDWHSVIKIDVDLYTNKGNVIGTISNNVNFDSISNLSLNWEDAINPNVLVVTVRFYKRIFG